MCKTCQQFKKRNTLYGHLPPKNIAELKPGGTVNIDLIGTYRKSIIQHQTGFAVILKNDSLTCMNIIDTATGWFEIFKMPMFDLDEVMSGNNEYIDKLSDRVSQLFTNIWMCRYPRP